MKKISLFALVLLFVLTSCEKKPSEITVDSQWTGSMEVQGIPLSSTITIYSDESFVLDATVSFMGIGMDFNKVGLGTVQGDSTAAGELIFTLETLAPDIITLLESVGIVAIPLPLSVSATIQDTTLTLPDIGLGQEIILKRQEVQ